MHSNLRKHQEFIFKKKPLHTKHNGSVFGEDENIKEQLQKWQANSKQLIANI